MTFELQASGRVHEVVAFMHLYLTCGQLHHLTLVLSTRVVYHAGP
jgi:hypothetical protein